MIVKMPSKYREVSVFTVSQTTNILINYYGEYKDSFTSLDDFLKNVIIEGATCEEILKIYSRIKFIIDNIKVGIILDTSEDSEEIDIEIWKIDDNGKI